MNPLLSVIVKQGKWGLQGKKRAVKIAHSASPKTPWQIIPVPQTQVKTSAPRQSSTANSFHSTAHKLASPLLSLVHTENSSNLLTSAPSVKEAMSTWNTDPEILLTQPDGEKTTQASSDDVSTPTIYRLLNYFLQRTVKCVCLSGYSHPNYHAKDILNQNTNTLLPLRCHPISQWSLKTPVYFSKAKV